MRTLPSMRTTQAAIAAIVVLTVSNTERAQTILRNKSLDEF